MKKIVGFAALSMILFSCGDKKVENNTEVSDIQNVKEYVVFGDSISSEGALSSAEMMDKFSTLKEGDTIAVKFKSSINDVCQKKGCWMTLSLGEEQQSFVKFKDYAFFVPKNAQEKEAIVNGKAYVSVVSVDELKHYAKDEGKSQEAIDSITAPKVTYAFMADGVLISK
ncbi:DUF4920 domain-containing protein [Flavobacterium chuncheonense]|uniref:DUF4920 domain-containing protein n=1 Tax=Flavobacterium chuncheonense TaxID=2026653 RepID=A0ABW5YK28_9FLAO